MEKGVKLEIAIGVLIIIAVMIGGFAWLGKKQQQQIQTATTAQSAKNQTLAPQSGEPMSDPGTGNGAVGQTDLVSDQNTADSVLMENVKMEMPDSWTIKNIQNRMYIKDNNVKSGYDTSLVLSVKATENDVTDMNALQNEGAGTDFTDIKDGKIFKVPNCGAVACFGAIIKDKIYSFNWDIQTNDPNPQNVRNDFNADSIWNTMKTVTIE